eukprot:4191169-Pleurochrysis_carterae.AAC.1
MGSRSVKVHPMGVRFVARSGRAVCCSLPACKVASACVRASSKKACDYDRSPNVCRCSIARVAGSQGSQGGGGSSSGRAQGDSGEGAGAHAPVTKFGALVGAVARMHL